MHLIRLYVKNTWDLILILFYFFTSSLLSVIIKVVCNLRQLILAHIWKLFLNGLRPLPYTFFIRYCSQLYTLNYRPLIYVNYKKKTVCIR